MIASVHETPRTGAAGGASGGASDASGGENVRLRYAWTVAARSAHVLFSFASATLVPRALGPLVYGNYNFLLGTNSTIRSILEPSVQQAFFTFSSQERSSGSLSKLYAGWLAVQGSLMMALIGLSAVFGVSHWIWPGQRLADIVLITLLDWAAFLALSLQQLGDSKGLTARPQMMGAGASLLGAVVLAGLYLGGGLNFHSFAVLNLSISAVLGAVLAHWLLVRHTDLCWAGPLWSRARGYVGRWWRYTSPILVLEYVTPLVTLATVYLIQVWYGPREQGFFAIASRWPGLLMIFTSSGLMIFWRELAHSTAAGDLPRAARIYEKFTRLLFYLVTVLGLWLSLSGETLLTELAGPEYRAAVPVLQVMAFYPMVQTIGQLNTAALKAMERTREYRNIAYFLMVPEVLLTYFLLAPSDAGVPGLGLGALGAALRLVVYGLLSVQVYEAANARFLNFRHAPVLLNRLAAAAGLAFGAFVSLALLGGYLRRAGCSPLVALGVSSPVYFLIAGGIVVLWPSVVGASRTGLSNQARALFSDLRGGAMEK